MLKMIEVIGISDIGFTEAVKNAIEKLIKDGEKVHFFIVNEQRGSVRNAKIQEFQVVLKVAIE